MLGELEVIGIHSKVVHDEGVVHEVGEVSRNGKITETHHLLGGVDDDRVVDAGPVWLWILLKPPQTTNVIAAFIADRHQALIQTALDTGQT